MRRKYFFFLLTLTLFLSFSYRDSYRDFKKLTSFRAKYFYKKVLFEGKEIFLPKLPDESIGELKTDSIENPDLLPYLGTAYIEKLDFKNGELAYLKYFKIKRDLNSLSLLLDFYHKRGEFQKEVYYLLEGASLNLKDNEKRDILKKAEDILNSYLPKRMDLREKVYVKEVELFKDHIYFLKLAKLLQRENKPILTKFREITKDRWELLFGQLFELLISKNYSKFYELFYKNYDFNMPGYLKKFFFSKLATLKSLSKERDILESKLFASKTSFRDFSLLFSYVEDVFGKKKADEFLRFYVEKRLNRGGIFSKDEKIYLLKLSNEAGDDLYSVRILNSLFLEGDLTKEEKVFSYSLLIDILLNKDFSGKGFNKSSFSFLKNSSNGDNTFGTLNSLISLLFNKKDINGDFNTFKNGSYKYFSLYLCDRLLLKIKKLDEERYVDTLLSIIDRYDEVLTLKKRIDYLKILLPLLKSNCEKAKVYLKIARMYRDINRGNASKKYYQLFFLISNPEILRRNKTYSYWGINTYIDREKDNYFNVIDEYVSLLTNLRAVSEIVSFFSNLLEKYPDNENIYLKFLDVLERFNVITREVDTYNVVLDKFKDDDSLYGKAVRFFYRIKRYEKVKSITRSFIDKFKLDEISSFLRRNISNIDRAKDLKKYLYYYALLKYPLNKDFLDKYTYYNKGMNENIYFKYSLIYPDYLKNYFKILSKFNELDFFYKDVKNKQNGLLKDYFITEYYLYKCEYEKGLPFALNFLKKYYYLPEISKRYVTLLRSFSFKEDKYLNVAVSSLKNYFLQRRESYDPLVEIADIYFENGYLKEGKETLYEIISTFKYDKDAYTKVATVFWDYFLNDDAIKVLLRGRRVLNDDSLFGYELGGIYESEKDYKSAVAAYVSSGLNEYNYMISDRLSQILSKHPELIPFFEEKLTDLILKKKDDSIFWNVKDFYDNYGDENLKFKHFLKNFIEKCNDVKLLLTLDENIGMDSNLEILCYEKIFKLRGGMYSLLNFEIFKKYVGLLKDEDLEKTKLYLKNFYGKFFRVKEVADFSSNFFKEIGDKADSQFVIEKSFKISKVGRFKREYGLKLLNFYLNNGFNEKFLSLLKSLKKKFKDNSFRDSLFDLEVGYLTKNGSADEFLLLFKDYYKFTGHLPYDIKREKRTKFLEKVLKNVSNKSRFSSILFETIRRLLLLNPEDENTLRMSYYLLKNVNQKEELFKYFRKNFKNSPKDYRLAFILGNLYFYDMDLKNSEFFFKKSIEIRPEDETPYLKLIEVYKNSKNCDDKILNVYISLYNATLSDIYLKKVLKYAHLVKKDDVFQKYLKVYLSSYLEDYRPVEKAKLLYSFKEYIAASRIAGDEIFRRIKIGEADGLGELLGVFINCAEKTGNYYLAIRMVSKLYYHSYFNLSQEIQDVFENKLIFLLKDFYEYGDENSFNELKSVENLFFMLSNKNDAFLRNHGSLIDTYLTLPTSTDFLMKINYYNGDSLSDVLPQFFKRGLFNEGIKFAPRNYHGEEYFDFMKGVINNDVPLILRSLSDKVFNEDNPESEKLYIRFLLKEKDFDPISFMKSDVYYLTKDEFLKSLIQKKLYPDVLLQIFDDVFKDRSLKVMYQRELLKYYLTGDLSKIKDRMLSLLRVLPLKSLNGKSFKAKEIYPNAKYTTFFGELLVKNGDNYGYKLIPAIVERIPSYQNYKKIFNFYKSEGDVKRCDEILKILREKSGDNFDLKFERFFLNPSENINEVLKLAKKDSDFRYALSHRVDDIIKSFKGIEILPGSPYFKLLNLLFFEINQDDKLIEFSRFLKSKKVSVADFLKGKMFYKNYSLTKLNKLLHLKILSEG